MFLPVILAGGAGIRLWPLSNALHPKQFHALTGGRSLLQETVARLDGLPAKSPLVVCNEEHRFVAAEQLREIGRDDATLVLEPFGRNTAPALALAALVATREGDDPTMLALPADHVVRDMEAFHAAIAAAAPLADAGLIVTFGIVPDRAETGYGYIRRGKALNGGPAFAVAGFEEKPGRATAERYVAEGSHFWNSGMFMARAGRYLEELERHRPDVLAACRRAAASIAADPPFLRIDAEAFSACPSVPIDRAVMEKTDAAAMVPLDAGWTDIGTWAALWEALPRDGDGNALTGDVAAVASRNSLVHAGGRRVVLLGVEDLVVVETADTVLVAHRDAVRDIGTVVDLVERKARGGEA